MGIWTKLGLALGTEVVLLFHPAPHCGHSWAYTFSPWGIVFNSRARRPSLQDPSQDFVYYTMFFPRFQIRKISLLLPFRFWERGTQDAEDEAAYEDKAEESSRDLVKLIKPLLTSAVSSGVNGPEHTQYRPSHPGWGYRRSLWNPWLAFLRDSVGGGQRQRAAVDLL